MRESQTASVDAPLPPDDGHVPKPLRPVIVGLLLILGVQSWLVVGDGIWGRPANLYALGCAALIALLPPTRDRLDGFLQRLRNPTAASRRVTMAAIFVGAAAYLYVAARYQGRPFELRWPDEFSYLLQMRMLASGRLWMPAHPLADFFDTFYMIFRPVYASQYSPGTAMLFVPALWLGAPLWLIPLLASAAVVGLTYRIVTELLDGLAGWLAALLVCSSGAFRLVSNMLLAQTPVLLLSLLAVWAWLGWRRRHQAWQAISIGLFAGWAAITRQVDAVCLLVPLVTAIALDLRPLRWKAAARSIVLMAGGMSPFLALQLIVNIGITGHWSTLPWTLYASRDNPQTALGFHRFDPTLRPASPLPQKQAMYDQMMVPAIQDHQPGNLLRNWRDIRLPLLLRATLVHPLLIILLPVGLLGAFSRRRWVIAASLALFVIFYGLYLLFMRHYLAVIVPAVAVIVVAAVDVVASSWPARRTALRTFLSLAMVGLLVTSQPSPNRLGLDWAEAADLGRTNQDLSILGDRPSVVLFPWDSARIPDEEPVYNVESASPDDATLIRAHDLGPRNRELFAYYAQRSPDRAFYRYHSGARRLEYLGRARDLADAQRPLSDNTGG